jgi:hypothetical protein
VPHTLFFENREYGRHANKDFPRGVAFLAHGSVWHSSVNFGGSIRSQPLAGDWLSLRKWVADTYGDTDPTESDYEPGTAYKRICWPLASLGNFDNAVDKAARTQSFVALSLLLTKMLGIFENVEPAGANIGVYGHKVRELLLLAAMEVEASWAAVLKVNGYSSGTRLSTNDYVKLRDVMLLDSYSLTLTSYPTFPRFAPFEGWDAADPTKSLDWYDAYNATKHNREEHLDAATLQRAIHAVGAVIVMFYAQFGFQFKTGDQQLPFLRSIFTMNFDGERHPHSYYIPNVNSAAHVAGPASWDWTLLDYPVTP